MWPRGMKEDDARLDEGMNSLAPSREHRRWIGHEPEKWLQFRDRYWTELAAREVGIDRLREAGRNGDVTLLYAAKSERRNNAVALHEYLERDG
jgi:uncharacterized protein YeaO (DUF488 family)